MAEALVDEKDSRTRADMVELVIVALLKVLSLSHFSHPSSISPGSAAKRPVLPGGNLSTAIASSSGSKMQVSDFPCRSSL